MTFTFKVEQDGKYLQQGRVVMVESVKGTQVNYRFVPLTNKKKQKPSSK